MTTLGGLIREMALRDREWANGKIQRMPNLWVLAGEDELWIGKNMADSGKKLSWAGEVMYSLRDDGRLIKLIRRNAVLCPNIELWPDAYKNKSVAWVADSTCRKCQHYLKAERRINYSRCAWARQQRCGDADPNVIAAQETLGAIGEAAKTVQELMA